MKASLRHANGAGGSEPDWILTLLWKDGAKDVENRIPKATLVAMEYKTEGSCPFSGL